MERSIPLPGSTQLPLKSRCRDCNYRKVDPVAGTGDTANFLNSSVYSRDVHGIQGRCNYKNNLMQLLHVL